MAETQQYAFVSPRTERAERAAFWRQLREDDPVLARRVERRRAERLHAALERWIMTGEVSNGR